MKVGNLRSNLFSALAGTALGTIFVFSVLTVQPAVAEDFCPDTFKDGPCTGGYCFVRGDGEKSCKYFQPSCNGGACTAGPKEGGGDDPVVIEN